MTTATWNPESPIAWARAMGMVPVPLFGRTRENVPAGSHTLLLDGPRASFTLSVGDSEHLLRLEESRTWTYSSNLLHSLIIDKVNGEMFSRRWDRPGINRQWPIPDARAAARIVEELAAEPIPTAETVISKMLRVFWALRNNIESLRGTDTDLIRSFNALLVWADATRRRRINVEAMGEPTELRDILPILQDQNLIDFGATSLSSDAIRSFPVGSLIEAILEREPNTGIVLDPNLFIRHASGVLYEAAHIAIDERPLTPPRKVSRQDQMTLFPVVLTDETPPKGESKKDARFTPPTLARALVQESLREMRAMQTLPKQLRVLDPACGSGVFLIEASREITADTGRAPVLVGYDVSEVAQIMTNFSLFYSTSEEGGRGPEFEVELKNSLLEPWDHQDIILMNPPFISWEKLDGDDKATVKRILGDHRYSRLPDYSMAFVAKAIDALKEGSVLATVIPATFLDSSAAERLRTAIQADSSLSVRLVGKFRTLNYFNNAVVEPALLVIARVPNHSRTRFNHFRVMLAENGHEDQAIRALRRADMGGKLEIDGWEISEGNPSELKASSWLPVAKQARKVLRSLGDAETPTVGDLFEVHQGIQTGLNPVFMIKSSDLKLFSRDPGFEAYFRPVADYIRDGAIIESDFVFYPYKENGDFIVEDDKELELALRDFYLKRLEPNRDRLAKRKSLRGRPWWSLNWPRPDWQPKFIPKIVTQAFGRRGSFSYDRNGRYAVHQGNAWLWKSAHPESPELMLAYSAVLNSSIFESLVSETSTRTQGGQYNINKKYIDSVNLPDLADNSIADDTLLNVLASFGLDMIQGRIFDLHMLDQAASMTYGFSVSRPARKIKIGKTNTIDAKFRRLSDEWLRGMGHSSDPIRLMSHPAFQEIVRMGPSVIPLIIRHLAEKPNLLVWALPRITGANPVPVDSNGNIGKMVHSWIEWGKSRNFV